MGLTLTDEMRASIKASLVATPSRKTSNTKRSHYRYNKGRPHASDALGVHPDQVQEYRDHLKKHGVTAEVKVDGRVMIESDKQFREVAKAGGLWNGRDGYAAYDSDGNRIMTGREQGQGQSQLKRHLKNEIRGYPTDFPAHLQRRDR
jgi:hypothetical protein